MLAARLLEARGAHEAAARVRALPEVTGEEVARATMPALERIGRATMAPPEPVRAASQCAGAVLRLAMQGGGDVGTAQLVAAVARLAVSTVRAGIPAPEVISFLAVAGA